MAKLATVRLILALAAIFSWSVHVCDVDNAFLNAPLKEEIYLAQPAGADDGTGRVFRLLKALYGLKQAPKAWNEERGRYLEAEGYERTGSDDALFIRWEGDHFTFIPSYVDDLMLVGSEDERVDRAKKMLEARFKIKDLGEVSTYLGMQVTRKL